MLFTWVLKSDNNWIIYVHVHALTDNINEHEMRTRAASLQDVIKNNCSLNLLNNINSTGQVRTETTCWLKNANLILDLPNEGMNICVWLTGEMRSLSLGILNGNRPKSVSTCEKPPGPEPPPVWHNMLKEKVVHECKNKRGTQMTSWTGVRFKFLGNHCSNARSLLLHAA